MRVIYDLVDSHMGETDPQFVGEIKDSVCQCPWFVAQHSDNQLVTAQVASDTSRQPEFRDQRLRVGAQGGQQVPTLFSRG